MKWKDHISLISTKVFKGYWDDKYGKIITNELLKMLYLGLFKPHSRYCPPPEKP